MFPPCVRIPVPVSRSRGFGASALSCAPCAHRYYYFINVFGKIPWPLTTAHSGGDITLAMAWHCSVYETVRANHRLRVMAMQARKPRAPNWMQTRRPHRGAHRGGRKRGPLGAGRTSRLGAEGHAWPSGTQGRGRGPRPDSPFSRNRRDGDKADRHQRGCADDGWGPHRTGDA